MATREASASPSSSSSLPGSKIAAGVVWCIGAFMTAQFLIQATGQNTPWIWLLALGGQYVMTLAESPIWWGKPNPIAIMLLVADMIINFGGCMAILNGVDQTGSAQAITATFLGWTGAWPGPIKGLLSFVVAAAVAALPEALWRQ